MKKITLARIISRLVSRFKLQEFTDEVFSLSEVVRPVTNIDELLKTAKVVTIAGVNVTATGVISGLVVPAGKRWSLFGTTAQLNTGTFTFSTLYVSDLTTNMTIYNAPSSAGLLFSGIIPPIPLDTGWEVRAYCDSKSVNGTCTFNALVLEEDAY